MNSKHEQKNKLKFWSVGNVKVPIRYEFKKIAQIEIQVRTLPLKTTIT